MKMKLFAAAAVAVCSMVAAPAFAQDINISAGYVGIKTGLGHTDGYEAAGSFSTAPASGAWGFQGDLNYLDGDSIPDQLVSLTGTAFKQNDTNRYGAYLNYTDAFGTDGFEAGGIGQLFNEHYTLTGSIGYGSIDDTPSFSYYNVGAKATFYVTETISLSGNLQFNNAETGAGSSSLVGADIEYKPKALPISIYAGYNRTDPSGASPSIDFTSVGVKFNFGNRSLRDRDQKGTVVAPSHLRFF